MRASLAILLVLACAACQESDPQLRSDTSTDTAGDVGPTVPACEVAMEWSMTVTQTDSQVGSVSARVVLESGGSLPTCWGPPCLVVTVLPSGSRVEEVTQDSPSQASFTFTSTDIPAGGEGELMLRWRIVCIDTDGERERVLVRNVKVCADSSSRLSIAEGTCP